MAASADEELHVFYPEVGREAHQALLDQIISGIEDGTRNRVNTYTIASTQELEEYRSLIETSAPGTVIMLANLANNYRSISEQPAMIITGASQLTDLDIGEGLTGISMSPDPISLFDQLLELEPDVEKVSVIYHLETNGWLVDLAERYAQEIGLEFEAIEALNVREAAGYFRRVLNHDSDVKHSLWLLQGDPTLDERGLLPELLVQAWDSNCIIFSSNPTHVGRGALFSLFPDYYEMGRSLAEFSQGVLAGEDMQPMPVNDLRKAVNTRTAEHLGIRLSRSEQREFDLIYPSR